MSTFANSVKRTCAAVCPLYGDVPMGAPGPPGQKGPPGPPVSSTEWMFVIRPNSAAFPDASLPTDLLHQSVRTYTHFHFALSYWAKCYHIVRVWTGLKSAEVFGRKAWNENITIFHVSMRTNKESQTRHLVCVEWFFGCFSIGKPFSHYYTMLNLFMFRNSWSQRFWGW